MARQVKGVLFVDYVRMLRALKTVDWSQHFPPEDLEYLRARIQPDAWYPMETFERFGVAILEQVVGGNMDLVRAWGASTVDELHSAYDGIVLANDPRDSLMRFQVLRSSFFDFEAIAVRELYDTEVRVRIDYGMGPKAEEAACWQARGFFERLVEIAGGTELVSEFLSSRWLGDAATLLVLKWKLPIVRR
jgi:hypothetical protein